MAATTNKGSLRYDDGQCEVGRGDNHVPRHGNNGIQPLLHSVDVACD